MTNLPTILAQHKRIAIVGGPKCGKSTLAAQVKDRPVIATDDSKHASWANQPDILKARVDGQPRFVAEGVQVARALRKGLEVDAIIIMDTPHEPLTPGQEAMAKGHSKILREALEANPTVPIYRIDKQ